MKYKRTMQIGGLLGGGITCLLVLIQLAFGLAVMAGIIYFIVFAITHWLRW